MEKWIRGFRKDITDAGVKVHELIKYVDDVLTVVGTLEPGARWTANKTISYFIKDILEDLEAKRTKQQVTMEVLKAAANMRTPYLKFTGEVSEDTKGIPVLDTRVWVGECKGGSEWFPGSPIHGQGQGVQVLYSFYSKAMTNPLGMLRRSAISDSSKMSTAVSEIQRRLKNHSTEVDKK